jgi:Flp pilus assembly protein TadG
VAAVIARVKARAFGERGAELIEFAFILPLLAFLIAGIMDFGFLFQRYAVVTNAAREGARVGVLPDYSVTHVQQRVATYFTASGLPAPTTPASVTYGTVEVSPGGPQMSVVTVNIQYPHEFLFLGPIAGLLGGGAYANINLTASSTMRREVANAN